VSFSLDSYRALLTAGLDAGYVTAGFTDPPTPGRTLLLRHDVDYSLDMALQLARVNAELGAGGTFFILLRGHAYNPLSSTSMVRLHDIVGLGQRLALHAAGPHAKDRLVADFEYLAGQLPLEPAFSWHNPTPEQIAADRNHDRVSGLVNVYSRPFLEEAEYLSDSNFRNSPEDLVAALQGALPVMHLLIHPINWVAGGASMLEVFARAWPYILRESEREARSNRVYASSLPDGMPESLLIEFSRRWREAAG
jgi:hypothetical protein